jgi:chromosome segregation ATPase
MEFSISSTLEAFEKEIFLKQKAYAELAKEKINEALANREQYIAEFYSLLDKGMGVGDALGKFSKRYANNPYIKGIIETTIAGELRVQSLKDKGIEELNGVVARLKDKIEELKVDIDTKETEIASLNQTIEATVVSHTKQLEKIEAKIIKFLEDRDRLIEQNRELEELIDRQKSSLDEKDREIRYYTKQIEQLKEENRLAISTTNLLKISNRELEDKLKKIEK